MRDYFEINQTLSMFDFYKGTVYLWRKNRKFMFFLYFPALMVLLLGFLIVIGSPKPGRESVTAVGQGLFLLVFTICFYLVGFLVIILLMRILRPAMFKNTVYTFNHWGMHRKMGNTEFSLPWRSFSRWEEKKSFFLLYVAGNDAHLISTRAFNDKEREEFRSFLSERLGS